MKFTKDDIISFAGSLLFHLIIFLILWFTVLKTVVPEEDEGVLVNFGNLNAAAGTFEPRYTGEVQTQETYIPPPPPVDPIPAPVEEVVTQDIEESVAVSDPKEQEKQREEEERKRREAEERERKLKEEAERKRLAEEQRKREEEISNQVAGAFGMGSAEGTSQGDLAENSGNQGSPFGNTDQGANEGTGGYGSFNLNGRTIGAGGLPRPAYTVQEEGKVVINITVDPKGNVIFAEIGRGTNIDNASMRNSAIEAARRAKFNSITGTNNQQGTITYTYKLR